MKWPAYQNLRLALIAIVSVIVVQGIACPVFADNKNGVSPTTISRPTGPGSLEGLGDAFQPALNTGTARYAVRFALPEGVAGFTPEFSLRYDSGQGSGVAGIGWSFGPGSIRRQTDKGLPRYSEAAADAPDRFLGMNGEELVPLANGYYLAKVEGSFIRYRRIDNHWEAHTKNGTKLTFGLSSNTRLSDPTGTRIYEWHLESQTDTNGNVIEYSYILPDEANRQVYLSEIRYGPGAGPWDYYYCVSVGYEDRPDPRTDYRSGFKVRTAKRVLQVDVKYVDALIRRYTLGYETHPHWSLLSRVTQYGVDEISTLPITTFGYATFDVGDPQVPLSVSGEVIESVGEPGTVMDNAKVDLIDINADGLPDLISTDAGHLAYLNRGVEETMPGHPSIVWEGPVAIGAVEPRAFDFELSDDNVHLADMTGDGIADLVATALGWVEYFPNTGKSAWGASRLMSVEHSPPPAPFGVDGDGVVTLDLDFDKRMDVLKSQDGAYSVWLNLGGGAFGGEVLTDGAWHGYEFIDFADPGVQLADMNGDRLSDVVKVTPISVVYCASMGFGEFDQYIQMFLPDRSLDDSPNGNLHRAKLTDVNGDGLADLVVERANGTDVWFWLNMGNDTFSFSRVITDLPATGQAETRWADINGNGTTDLIYADSTLPVSKINAVDLGQLIAGTSHLNALTSIDNGFGRHTEILYRSITDFYVEARQAGRPWTMTIPFPSMVVSRIETSIGLDLDGYPDEGSDGDTYITDFVYRDGYYDPLEKQFRGFAFVKQIQRGDERFGGTLAPTLVTRYRFHTGQPDQQDNDEDGQTDEWDEWAGREEEPLKGIELWRETCSLPDDPGRDGDFADDEVVFERTETTWEVRDLSVEGAGPLGELLGEGYGVTDQYSRSVRQAVATVVRRSITERQSNPGEHKFIETRYQRDALGATVFELKLGDLANANDDLYTGYEYARNEAGWIVDRVSRTLLRVGNATGAFVSDVRNYYDGLPFHGLPLGEVGEHGHLVRSESLISDGKVPAITERSLLRGDPRDAAGRVDTIRRQYDDFGNPIVSLDANATLNLDGLPDGTGHERRIAYDPHLHKFPTTETIIVGNWGCDLESTATYHFGFESPLTVADFNGHATTFTYDTFGRQEKEIAPGDDADEPTRRYLYDWGEPVSSVATVAHTRQGNSPDVITTEFYDGFGRSLGTFETGGPVMSNVTLYNTRGKPWRVIQPYFGEPFDEQGHWSGPGADSAATTTAFDAFGRAVQTVTPADEHGIAATLTSKYLPLRVIESDGEDNIVGGPHADTPKTLVHDGLGRLIAVHEIETISAHDSGEFVTRYRYSLPDLLAEIEDANGNIRYMRYDGLGRKIFMSDCNRGYMTYTYDPVGNILAVVDAKEQQIVSSYDGVNRLFTEDYLDQGTPLSFERTPDIIYHYDTPSEEYPNLPDLRGQLAWVEDLTGVQFRGYDDRGNIETVVKRVNRIDGSTRDWTTVTLSDSLGRVYQTVYPDASVVRRRYDERGALQAVPDFVENLTYFASGKKEQCTFANDVASDYTYDPRERLTWLTTQSSTEIHQDLTYEYDQADNLLGIVDGRILPPDDPRNQAASFIVDNSYRLAHASGIGYGTIEYDYDRLGNMVTKTSPDVSDPTVNLGELISGGADGTAGRVGRAPGDPPGPHAITSSYDGEHLGIYAYDDNGNMINNDGDEYLYDFEDRIGGIIKDGRDIRYLYDYAGQRVIKRVDGVQTTYINKLSEVRDEELIKYIFAGQTRVARVEGSIPPPANVTQRISLKEGWNLISFQVIPGTVDPAAILADIAGIYTMVYGHDGSTYLRHSAGSAGNTLTSMMPNRGYWIHMTVAAELVLEGAISDEPVQVPASHSVLIGVPGFKRHSWNDLRTEYHSIKKISAYLGDDVGWVVSDADSPGFVNTLSGSAPGLAYWVAADEETGITVLPAEVPITAYFHGDHLGSGNVWTSSDGRRIHEIAYYPFGATRFEESSRESPFDAHYGFTDKEQDKESGLANFGSRYYASQLGRFTRVDPLLVVAPILEAPQALNVYAYSLNRPLTHTDPTGMQPVNTVFNPPAITPAQRASMARDIAHLRATGLLGPAGVGIDVAGMPSGASKPRKTQARSGGRGVMIEEVNPDVTPSTTEQGRVYINTAAGETFSFPADIPADEMDRDRFATYNRRTIDIQTEIGGINANPSGDIYADIEAAGGFSDFDASASGLPMFQQIQRHQDAAGIGSPRIGTYKRDAVGHYLRTGNAPRGHNVDDLQQQVSQEITAENRVTSQMYEE